MAARESSQVWPEQARGTACQMPARAMRPCIRTPLACAPGPMSSDCSFADHRLQCPLCLASQVWPEQGHEHRSQLSLASRSSPSLSGTSLRWVPRRCTSTACSVAAAQSALLTDAVKPAQPGYSGVLRGAWCSGAAQMITVPGVCAAAKKPASEGEDGRATQRSTLPMCARQLPLNPRHARSLPAHDSAPRA